jgi:general secretion pathway protein G
MSVLCQCKKLGENMNIQVLRRRYITLIEIMIVMFLIALIAGATAYNFRGSLDEGKAFKTKAAIEQIENALNLQVAENPELQDSITSPNVWHDVIKRSRLIKNPNALYKDGWGGDFTITIESDGEIKASSRKYDEYANTHSTMFGKEKTSE